MRYWHIKHRTLGEQFAQTPDDQTPHDCGYSKAWTLTELEGAPGDYDIMVDGVLIERTEQKIDDEYRAAHGDDAITLAHMRKAIEARLIVAGYSFEGLLTAEAEATGQSVQDLVAAVLENDTIAGEVQRRAAKVETRKGE